MENLEKTIFNEKIDDYVSYKIRLSALSVLIQEKIERRNQISEYLVKKTCDKELYDYLSNELNILAIEIEGLLRGHKELSAKEKGFEDSRREAIDDLFEDAKAQKGE